MTVADAVRVHLASLEAGRSKFQDSLELVDRFFEFTPTGFHNGPIYNAAGENSGSCRMLSLAQYCTLNESQTLQLFAEHYQSVLDDPAGTAHVNIRQFMTTGWSGVSFDGTALRKRDTQSQSPHDHTEDSQV